MKGEISDEFAETVRVLSYRPAADEFALQLLTTVPDESVIAYRPAGEHSFAEAIAWVREWRGAWNPGATGEDSTNDRRLHEGDDLRLPEISLSMRSDLWPALRGELIVEGETEPWTIGAAVSAVDLKMDARGVRFQWEAPGEIDPFAPDPPPPVPRKFWFDRPFFLFLWRDGGAWPYAAAWIGGGEGLVGFGDPGRE